MREEVQGDEGGSAGEYPLKMLSYEYCPEIGTSHGDSTSFDPPQMVLSFQGLLLNLLFQSWPPNNWSKPPSSKSGVPFHLKFCCGDVHPRQAKCLVWSGTDTHEVISTVIIGFDQSPWGHQLHYATGHQPSFTRIRAAEIS